MANSDQGQIRPAGTAPRPVPVNRAALARMASTHGVPIGPLEPIEPAGIINSVYRLGGRFVLRVPLDHPGHVAQAHREAQAIPAAVRAGVRTPDLVVFDDSLDILPVPYLIVEWVDATSAEALGVVPPEPQQAWRHLGSDIARIHRSNASPPPGEPWPDEQRDPRDLVERRAEDGWLSPLEAHQFHAWLERLAPHVADFPAVFLHGDLQMSNVLLAAASGEYQAVIDWGGARRGNPADDFSVVPLAAVGPMLEGYRDLAPTHALIDEASILWRRIQLVLQLLPRGAAPGWAWAERPVARLTDMLFSFPALPDSPWRELSFDASARRPSSGFTVMS